MALPALAPGASALAQAVLGWGVPPEPGVTHGGGQGPPEYSAPPGGGSRAGTRAMRPPRVPLSTGHEPSTLSRPGHPIPGHTPLWGHPTLPAALPQLCWQPGGDSSSVSPSMPGIAQSSLIPACRGSGSPCAPVPPPGTALPSRKGWAVPEAPGTLLPAGRSRARSPGGLARVGTGTAPRSPVRGRTLCVSSASRLGAGLPASRVPLDGIVGHGGGHAAS